MTEIIRPIDEAKPSLVSEFDGVKHYLTRIKAHHYELRNSFKVDFMGVAPGNKYLSFPICSKLLNTLKKEMIHALGTNYLTLEEILYNYNEVIKTFIITRNKTNNNISEPIFPKRPIPSERHRQSDKPISALDYFNTQIEIGRSKVVPVLGVDQSRAHCPKFTSRESQFAGYKEKNVCSLFFNFREKIIEKKTNAN